MCITAVTSEAAAGGASQAGLAQGPGVHSPVGKDAVYAEGAPRTSRVVLRHGGEVLFFTLILLHDQELLRPAAKESMGAVSKGKCMVLKV